MPNYRITNNNQQGFTLLEIMLVLLLMGMISVGVVMTLPSSLTSDQSVNWQAQRFSTLLQFAEDEAMISGVELGLVFTPEKNTYEFTFYDYKSRQWLPVSSKQIAGLVELPSSMRIEYELSGSVWDEVETEDEDVFIEDEYLIIDDEKDARALKPQVYVMSSGEVTPFTLAFSSLDGDRKKETQTLSVSMSGDISLSELVKP